MSGWRRRALAIAVGADVAAVFGNTWGMTCSVAATGVNFGVYNPLSGAMPRELRLSSATGAR